MVFLTSELGKYQNNLATLAKLHSFAKSQHLSKYKDFHYVFKILAKFPVSSASALDRAHLQSIRLFHLSAACTWGATCTDLPSFLCFPVLTTCAGCAKFRVIGT